jgi:hypothetical protein
MGDLSRLWLSCLGHWSSDIDELSRLWLSCLGRWSSDIGDLSRLWLSCLGRWSSDIGDLSRLWLSCLGRWSSYSKIFIYYLAFQSFRLGWTWWRLFQKHIVLIELDICYITKELNLKINIKSITVSVIWFKRIISHTYVQLNKKM